jgi:hypothetical protein
VSRRASQVAAGSSSDSVTLSSGRNPRNRISSRRNSNRSSNITIDSRNSNRTQSAADHSAADYSAADRGQKRLSSTAAYPSYSDERRGQQYGDYTENPNAAGKGSTGNDARDWKGSSGDDTKLASRGNNEKERDVTKLEIRGNNAQSRGTSKAEKRVSFTQDVHTVTSHTADNDPADESSGRSAVANSNKGSRPLSLINSPISYALSGYHSMSPSASMPPSISFVANHMDTYVFNRCLDLLMDNLRQFCHVLNVSRGKRRSFGARGSARGSAQTYSQGGTLYGGYLVNAGNGGGGGLGRNNLSGAISGGNASNPSAGGPQSSLVSLGLPPGVQVAVNNTIQSLRNESPFTALNVSNLNPRFNNNPAFSPALNPSLTSPISLTSPVTLRPFNTSRTAVSSPNSLYSAVKGQLKSLWMTEYYHTNGASQGMPTRDGSLGGANGASHGLPTRDGVGPGSNTSYNTSQSQGPTLLTTESATWQTRSWQQFSAGSGESGLPNLLSFDNLPRDLVADDFDDEFLQEGPALQKGQDWGPDNNISEESKICRRSQDKEQESNSRSQDKSNSSYYKDKGVNTVKGFKVYGESPVHPRGFSFQHPVWRAPEISQLPEHSGPLDCLEWLSGKELRE